jgi:hypothetical protein
MEADGLRIARAVFHCSLGDVAIALATFGLYWTGVYEHFTWDKSARRVR